MGKRRFSWMDAAKVVLVMLLATAAGYLFAWLGFPETNIVLIYKQSGAKANPVYQTGELRLDAEKRKVYLGENEIHVTPMEYSLLLLLFKNQGKVLTTSVILREIWGAGYGQDTQALRTLTAGLRRKIEKNPARPRYILTEIGVGYRLAEERE